MSSDSFEYGVLSNAAFLLGAIIGIVGCWLYDKWANRP